MVCWIAQGVLQKLHIMRSTKKRINILSGLSGTIKPGRLMLLLGPPSSGKTTLLKALASSEAPASRSAMTAPPLTATMCVRTAGQMQRPMVCPVPHVSLLQQNQATSASSLSSVHGIQHVDDSAKPAVVRVSAEGSVRRKAQEI